jgi:hypothetical protein
MAIRWFCLFLLTAGTGCATTSGGLATVLSSPSPLKLVEVPSSYPLANVIVTGGPEPWLDEEGGDYVIIPYRYPEGVSGGNPGRMFARTDEVPLLSVDTEARVVLVLFRRGTEVGTRRHMMMRPIKQEEEVENEAE